MEIYYIPDGIHILSVTDKEQKHWFGPGFSAETDPDLRRAALKFEDGKQHLMGLQGRWKFDGLKSISMILFDDTCQPTGGTFVAPAPIPETIVPITVTEPSKSEKVYADKPPTEQKQE